MLKYFVSSIITVILLIILINNSYSQDNNSVRLGKDELLRSGSNYYNYSDPNRVNIEVNVWGFVKSPGRYLVPNGTKLSDLLSLSGGLLFDAQIDTMKLYRANNDSLNIKAQQININYQNLFQRENSSTPAFDPVLQPGDVLVIISGEPRVFYSTRENVSFILSITAALVSVGILILNISNTNK